MLAFNNDAKLKEKYIGRAALHRKSGNFLRDTPSWKNGRGDVIGCLAETLVNAPLRLEETTGLPETLNWIAGQIFEGLPEDKYADWPHRYVSAGRPGANLTLASRYFFVWLLSDKLLNCFDVYKFPAVAACSGRVARLYWQEIEGWGKVLPEEWKDAARTASRTASQEAHAAAYSDLRDTLAAAYAAFTVNYAVRTMNQPRMAACAVNSAGMCGIGYETMADELIRIIKGVEPATIHPQATLHRKEGRYPQVS